MLRFVVSLRSVMLVASVGAAIGAVLMFWEGGAQMATSALALASGDDREFVITSIMRGTDAFLFGIVLIIFAYGVAIGFVFEPSAEGMEGLPSWMRVTSVAELRDALVEVILLYLLVDFATDWPEIEGAPSWAILAKPLSILAIAAAFGLFPNYRSPTDRSE